MTKKQPELGGRDPREEVLEPHSDVLLHLEVPDELLKYYLSLSRATGMVYALAVKQLINRMYRDHDYTRRRKLAWGRKAQLFRQRGQIDPAMRTRWYTSGRCSMLRKPWVWTGGPNRMVPPSPTSGKLPSRPRRAAVRGAGRRCARAASLRAAARLRIPGAAWRGPPINRRGIRVH